MARSRRLYDPDPLPLQHSGPPHLAEPLTQSAAWVAAIAEWTCVRNGGLSCSWYHGTWQYLRLLDLVSTPSWHASLRKAMAAQSAHRTGLRVLVSGCADYAMYALVHSQLGGSGRITVLDTCPTPLVGVSWYARKAGAPVPELIVADATKHCRPGYYDLVVSDSFPPRFSENKLHSLLRTWYESLSPGGAVITTVRLHSEGADANPQKGRRLHQWLQVAAEARSWWPEVSGLPHEELIRRISGFRPNSRGMPSSMPRPCLHCSWGPESSLQPSRPTATGKGNSPSSHRTRDRFESPERTIREELDAKLLLALLSTDGWFRTSASSVRCRGKPRERHATRWVRPPG